jgi:hypothetical protein
MLEFFFLGTVIRLALLIIKDMFARPEKIKLGGSSPQLHEEFELTLNFARS